MNTTCSYELMVILYPEISEEDRQAFQSKLEQEITSRGGHLTNLEVWGKRTLAYEIENRTEGYYLLAHFDISRQAVKAVHNACLLDPRVMRHKIFRLDLPEVVPSAGGSD